mgnify:FL=1
MNNLNTDENIAGKQIQKRKKLLLIFAAVIVIVAGSSTAWWYFDLRDVQSTDDAYVKGNQIAISSLVAGSVISVNYTDTDLVRQGDVLVTLDDTDARINFNKAANNLANTVRKIKQMYIADDQYNANVQEAKIAYQQALADYQRRSRLQGAAAISRENMQHAKDAVDSSKAALDVAVQAYRGNRILIQNTALEKQPEVLMAAESMREAWVALQRTKVRSPVTGYLAQRNVQVGETIGSGQALMSIIPAEQVWINANFKETQLSGVKIGQKVSIVTDFYGSDVGFNGRVDGINMGTGSAFSVLPAQNATGNWIKVVQRLPVRITLDAEQIKAYPLRIGLSATVRLHETHSQGEALATTQRKTPAYASNALVIDTPPVDNEILNIIKANAM